jgi:hypothetical protein
LHPSEHPRDCTLANRKRDYAQAIPEKWLPVSTHDMKLPCGSRLTRFPEGCEALSAGNPTPAASH